MPLLTDAALEAQVLAAQSGDRDAFARLVPLPPEKCGR